MGGDLRIADAARVSFHKESSLDENGELRQSDARILKYLADHDHWTPYAHVMVTLRIACPIFVARQWFRHTIGVARNEVSRRYVDEPPEYFLPNVIRERPDASIKQGSGGKHPNSLWWINRIEPLFEEIDRLYAQMIEDGVAPEQARMILPMAHMTEFYETASLAFYGRVAGLRLDSHAQEEIRDLMWLVDASVEPIAPVGWRALRQ
jgi:thymidylate synthase (FAD)